MQTACRIKVSRLDSRFRGNDRILAMENVLATYHLPYNPEVPVIVMDEQPVQLFKETRMPIATVQNSGSLLPLPDGADCVVLRNWLA